MPSSPVFLSVLSPISSPEAWSYNQKTKTKRNCYTPNIITLLLGPGLGIVSTISTPFQHDVEPYHQEYTDLCVHTIEVVEEVVDGNELEDYSHCHGKAPSGEKGRREGGRERRSVTDHLSSLHNMTHTHTHTLERNTAKYP